MQMFEWKSERPSDKRRWSTPSTSSKVAAPQMYRRNSSLNRSGGSTGFISPRLHRSNRRVAAGLA
jgi:hypothetical protein